MHMTDTLLRGAKALMAALRVASGAMLAASVGINFANIIGRYFLSVSLSWAEEAMLFLMIGCVFLGAAPVGWAGRHIRMDVAGSLFAPRARATVDGLFPFSTIPTRLALLALACPGVAVVAPPDQCSQSANIPLVIPQAMLPLGLLLMALLVVVRLVVQGTTHPDLVDRSEH